MAIKFSPQQNRSYIESDARINIWEGSVRSGKSYSCLMRFLKELRYGPDGAYIICGKTERTVLHNIIDPLNELTNNCIRYNRGLGEFTIFDRKVYVVGASDERAEGKIRGSTFAGALVDEISIIPESFFRMLLSRLSIPNAKVFGTTNPDSPYHWLKTDFIDRADELNLKVFKFRLEDNPSLTREFVDSLKQEYQGLWNKRFIEGEWVLAEGAIYDFFDEKFHVRRAPPTYAKYYLLGIDYGTTNPFAAVLLGFNDDHHPTLWVEKEYYWDSKKMGAQKTDYEYAEVIQQIFSPYPIKMIYLDPSAASFKVEMQRRRMPVKEANNDVIDGIRFVSTLISSGDLIITAHCPELIKEIEGYVWDEKAAKQGIDEPLKQRDHLCVSGNTKVTLGHVRCTIKMLYEMQFNNPQIRFDALGYKDGFIDTLIERVQLTGTKKKVVKLTLENGNSLTATPDHQVWTKRGYIEIQNLLPDDEVLCYN